MNFERNIDPKISMDLGHAREIAEKKEKWENLLKTAGYSKSLRYFLEDKILLIIFNSRFENYHSHFYEIDSFFFDSMKGIIGRFELKLRNLLELYIDNLYFYFKKNGDIFTYYKKPKKMGNYIYNTNLE